MERDKVLDTFGEMAEKLKDADPRQAHNAIVEFALATIATELAEIVDILRGKDD